MSEKLRGVFTALVCPFDRSGRIDFETFGTLVERQIAGGVHGLVPCGTTGETPALEADEWEEIVRRTVEISAGRVPVIAGTGSNNTVHSVARTRRARELGADAALVVTPYYNKPNRDGLTAHFRTVCEEGGLPVVVYNVPSRTGLNLQPEHFRDIARLTGVVAIKEASGRIVQAQSVIADAHEGVAVLSGEDDLTCAMTLMGGDGVISVVSNVDPAQTSRMVEAALRGDAAEARALHYKLQPLVRALFAETNPVPAKAALEILGLAKGAVRPPLAEASAETRAALAEALRTAETRA